MIRFERERARAVVVVHRQHRLAGRRQGRPAGWFAQRQQESLRLFVVHVVDQFHGKGGRHLPVGEGQHAVGGDVVVRRNGRAVGHGERHRDFAQRSVVARHRNHDHAAGFRRLQRGLGEGQLAGAREQGDVVERKAAIGNPVIIVLLELDLNRAGIGPPPGRQDGVQRDFKPAVLVAAALGVGQALDLRPVFAVHADGHAVGQLMARKRVAHGVRVVVEFAMPERQRHAALPGQIRRQHQLVQGIAVVGHVHGQMPVAGGRPVVGRDLDLPRRGRVRPPIIGQRAGFERFQERESGPPVVVADPDRRRDVAAQRRFVPGIAQAQLQRLAGFVQIVVEDGDGDRGESLPVGEPQLPVRGRVILARHGRAVRRGVLHGDFAIGPVGPDHGERRAPRALHHVRFHDGPFERAALLVHRREGFGPVVGGDRIELRRTRPPLEVQRRGRRRSLHDQFEGGRPARRQGVDFADRPVFGRAAFSLAAGHRHEGGARRQAIADHQAGRRQRPRVGNDQSIGQLRSDLDGILGRRDRQPHVRHPGRIVHLDVVEIPAVAIQVVEMLELDLEMGARNQPVRRGKGGQVDRPVRRPVTLPGVLRRIEQAQPMDSVHADRHAVGLHRTRERRRHGLMLVFLGVFVESQHHVGLARQIDRQNGLVQAPRIVVGQFHAKLVRALVRRRDAGTDPDERRIGRSLRPVLRQLSGLEAVEKRQGRPRRFVVQHQQRGFRRRGDVARGGGPQRQFHRLVAFRVRIVVHRNGERPAALARGKRQGFLERSVIRPRRRRSAGRHQHDRRRGIRQPDALDGHRRFRLRFHDGEPGARKPEHGIGDRVAGHHDVVDVPAAVVHGRIGRPQAPAEIHGGLPIGLRVQIEGHAGPREIRTRIAFVDPQVRPGCAIHRNLHAGVVKRSGLDAQPALEFESEVPEAGTVDRRRRQIMRIGQVVGIVAGQVDAIDVRAGESGGRIGISGTAAAAQGPPERPLALHGPAGIRLERLVKRRLVVPEGRHLGCGPGHAGAHHVGQGQHDRLGGFDPVVFENDQFHVLRRAALRGERQMGRRQLKVDPRRGRAAGHDVQFHRSGTRQHHRHSLRAVLLPRFGRGGRESRQPFMDRDGHGLGGYAVDIGGAEGGFMHRARFGFLRLVRKQAGGRPGIGRARKHGAGRQVAGRQRDLVAVVVRGGHLQRQGLAQRDRLRADGPQHRRLVGHDPAPDQDVVQIPGVERGRKPELHRFAVGNPGQTQQGKRLVPSGLPHHERPQLEPLAGPDADFRQGGLVVAVRAGVRIKSEVRGEVDGRGDQGVARVERAAVGQAEEMPGFIRRAAGGPSGGQTDRCIEVFLQQNGGIRIGRGKMDGFFAGAVLVFRAENDVEFARIGWGPFKDVGQGSRSDQRIGSKRRAVRQAGRQQCHFIPVQFAHRHGHGNGLARQYGPVGFRRGQRQIRRSIRRNFSAGFHGDVVEIPGAVGRIEAKPHAGHGRQILRTVQRKILGAARRGGNKRRQRRPSSAANGVVDRGGLVVASGTGIHVEGYVGRKIDDRRLQRVAGPHRATIGQALRVARHRVVHRPAIDPPRRHGGAGIEVLRQVGRRPRGPQREGRQSAARDRAQRPPAPNSRLN